MSDNEIEEAIPTPFRKLFRYVRGLGYAQRPDYEHVVSLYEDLQEASRQSNWLRKPLAVHLTVSLASRSSANFAISSAPFSRATAVEEEKTPPVGWQKKVESRSLGCEGNYLEVPMPEQRIPANLKRIKTNPKEQREKRGKRKTQARQVTATSGSKRSDHI